MRQQTAVQKEQNAIGLAHGGVFDSIVFGTTNGFFVAKRRKGKLEI